MILSIFLGNEVKEGRLPEESHSDQDDGNIEEQDNDYMPDMSICTHSEEVISRTEPQDKKNAITLDSTPFEANELEKQQDKFSANVQHQCISISAIGIHSPP